MIDCRLAARLRYTAKNLFVQNYVARQQQHHATLAYKNMAAKRGEWRASASIAWGYLHDADLEVWQLHERNHDAVQPYIADFIIEAICRNPTKSYEKIAEETISWCSCSTIQSWLAGHVTYSTYVEWIALSLDPMLEHLTSQSSLLCYSSRTLSFLGSQS